MARRKRSEAVEATPAEGDVVEPGASEAVGEPVPSDTSRGNKALTYVGPCPFFVDPESGLKWSHGETLVVVKKVADRLAAFRGKFECRKADSDAELAVAPDPEPPIGHSQHTPGF